MPTVHLVSELRGHTERVWHAIWHPSGGVIATCGSDSVVKLWRPHQKGDFLQWICYYELVDAHQRTIRSIAFSNCGKYLACASFDSTSSIYCQRKSEEGHSPEYKLIATLEGHENEVKCVAWNHAGNRVATCGRDKSVWIWEMEDDHEFECLAVLQEHVQDVKSVTWHPSEDIVISTSYDDTCKIWKEVNDDGDGDFSCIQTLVGHTSTVWTLSFHPAGHCFVTGSDDRCLKLWEKSEDSQDWVCKSTLSGTHERTIYHVDWCKNDPRYFASVGGDNALCIYLVESSNLNLLHRLQNAHAGDVNSVHWHPNQSNLLITAGDDNIVRLWRLDV